MRLALLHPHGGWWATDHIHVVGLTTILSMAARRLLPDMDTRAPAQRNTEISISVQRNYNTEDTAAPPA